LEISLHRIRAALIVASCVVACGTADESAAPGRTVLLVSIDTLRADALSIYGNPRPTSPHLDGLARDGVRFTTAVAPSPWTIPSHAALLTSLQPDAVGAGLKQPLPAGVTTLAEWLGERGFTTAAVVNFQYLDRDHGFDQGFQEFTLHRDRSDAPGVVARGRRFLERNRAQDVFLFLHLFDVHGPYDAPKPFGTRFTAAADKRPDGHLPFLRRIRYHDHLELEEVPNVAYLRARYEGGVARVDEALGDLFEDLRRLGLYDDALIVVTSDHGEAFFEHGVWVGHGLFLYENELRIPLILKLPREHGMAGLVSRALVSLVDVVPTILDALGLAAPAGIQGRSLLPVVRHAADVAKNAMPHAVFGTSSNLDARFVRTPRWKYIQRASVRYPRLFRKHLRPDPDAIPVLRERIRLDEQLYDLARDPDEMRNLIHERPEVAERLRRRLEENIARDDALRAGLAASGPVSELELTDEESRELRALGYAE
jgi:arylsulfatase